MDLMAQITGDFLFSGHGGPSPQALTIHRSISNMDEQDIKPDSAARNPTDGLRLLLVEDHVDTAKMLGKLLALAGYTVRTAVDAAGALALAACEPFDVMISDIGLPDATGYQLMDQIRQKYGFAGIAMSGYGMEEDFRKSQEAGFSEHLVKPISFAQLDDAIKKLFNT
jgi:two-component system, chemotaxis family, CheB/CheR fusion protein